MAIMYVAPDRLLFTLFLAIGAHVIVLLGLNLPTKAAPVVAPPLTLELKRGGDPVTQQATQKTDADEIAQQTLPVPRPPVPVAETQPAEILESARKPEAAPQELTPVIPSPRPIPFLDPSRVAQQIAALDDQRQQELGDSRVRRLSNLGGLSSAESAYLAMWRRKCERIGSNNYPGGNLQGELTLKVVIHHTGRLLEASLLRSSGHPALDEAALATVHQAAPYQPFNVEMRTRYDQLSFTRSWQFSRRSASID